MTGLKSGSGDDLWGDDSADESEEDVMTDSESNKTASVADEERTNGTETQSSEPLSGGVNSRSTRQGQPYIIRRAIQDKSVQFERDERLTFFVHDDVIEGERELLREAETAFGRDVPKFDVREAVYRAALQNQDDVLNELIEMGYSPSTE